MNDTIPQDLTTALARIAVLHPEGTRQYQEAIEHLKQQAAQHSGRTRAALYDAAIHLEVRVKPVTQFDELPEI